MKVTIRFLTLAGDTISVLTNKLDEYSTEVFKCMPQKFQFHFVELTKVILLLMYLF